MALKFVSYKACPFVQRVAITLQYKDVDYDIEYIDLGNPPDWFLSISPLKKVPIMIVDDTVIFESVVINEYIDEAYPPTLQPKDLLLKAINRSWVEFSNNISLYTFQLTIKEGKIDFESTLEELLDDFDRVEEYLWAEPFFNGKQFSLVDASYAPIFQRLNYLEQIYKPIIEKDRYPRLTNWKDNLLSLKAVKESTVAEIQNLYYQLLWTRQGYISNYLSEKEYGKRPTKKLY
ncbi:MAG: glutathione S-transferase family protein [Candidatus Thioglobus sp.]|jgi:glutathione S-transferase|nr:glutathione S-transferase family protein [Candidatus Thioglobus sp.]|tara:strand:- start:420 stop:1118 length:699 start_codon:yes stop_codon:yes gene_type:complete